MKITKDLKEYLQSFDFYSEYEIANKIADYYEKKHIDKRYCITDKYRYLADQYINENEIYLEDTPRTWKYDTDTVIKNVNMTIAEIIDYANTRDDLWEYENDELISFVEGNTNYTDIDDILDKFSHYGCYCELPQTDFKTPN